MGFRVAPRFIQELVFIYIYILSTYEETCKKTIYGINNNKTIRKNLPLRNSE